MTAIEPERTRVAGGLLDDWLARLNVETGLYILIGVVALGIRLIQLGNVPLSAAEAQAALSTWRRVSMADLPLIPPVSAGLDSLTAVSFWLFGASEFWARFWPVIAGVALVFTPLVFRRELGRGAALVASALLAVSPTLMAASRIADGTTLSALSLVVAAAGLRNLAGQPGGRGWLTAGLGFGLGLASGPRFISGIVASALALLVVIFARPLVARRLRIGFGAVRPNVNRILLVTVATFVLAASTGLLNPSGLSAATGGLLVWFAGWSPGADARSAWLVPQVLFIHEPLLMVMGAAGLYVAFLSGSWQALRRRVRLVFAAGDDPQLASPEQTPGYGLGAGALGESALGAGAAGGLGLAAVGAGGGGRLGDFIENNGAAVVLGAAALGALLYGLIYLGREAGDGVWVVLPLAMLAGTVLAETFAGDWFEGEFATVLAQAAVLFVMLVFVYFNLAGYGRNSSLVADKPLELRLYIAGAVVGLGLFVTVMFALGWTTLSALRGAALALGVSMLIGTLGAGFSLIISRSTSPNELWTASPTQTNINLMMQTIRDTSQRSAGQEQDLEIAVVNDPIADDQNRLLGWELRGFSRARFVDSMDLAVGSPIIIADAAVSDPRLESGYAGEKFPVQARPGQADPSVQSLVNWWLFREWPTEVSRTVALWVRADVHNLLTKPGNQVK